MNSEGGTRSTYLITGATSGIGRAAALRLAEHGRVLIGTREASKGEGVRRAIADRGGDATLAVADLASLAEVRALAARIRDREPRLDGLINNAGIFTRTREVTEEDHERQLAVNYLAPFVLCHELLPLVRAWAPARIVNVASEEHRLGRIHFEDPELERGYRGSRAYRQSKLALVLFTRELARRLAGTGVTVNAVHPGVVYTDLVRTISPLARLVRWLLRSPEDGAGPLVRLATAPELAAVTGAYFRRWRRVQPARRARDPATARRLWNLTERLSGPESSGGRPGRDEG